MSAKGQKQTSQRCPLLFACHHLRSGFVSAITPRVTGPRQNEPMPVRLGAVVMQPPPSGRLPISVRVHTRTRAWALGEAQVFGGVIEYVFEQLRVQRSPDKEPAEHTNTNGLHHHVMP